MATAGSDYPSLRNFTAQEWRKIIAKLPEGAAPTDEARLDLVIAANVYWETRAGLSLKEQARLVAEAVDHLRAGLDSIRVAAPQFQFRNQLAPLSALLNDLISYRDVLEGIPNPSSATLARSRREEFLDAALDLWAVCGGSLRLSRSPKGPTGPLINYLIVVSGIVMGEDAPAPETLAAFIRERRQR